MRLQLQNSNHKLPLFLQNFKTKICFLYSCLNKHVFSRNLFKKNVLDNSLQGQTDKPDLEIFQQLIFCSQISKRHLDPNQQSDTVDLNFVKTLVLYNLGLSSLQFLSRLSLVNLTHLQLHFNSITSINELVGLELPELKFVFLQMNKLQNLDEFHFLGWKKMKYLCLNKNNINCMHNVTKWQFNDIKKLILSQNDIQTILQPSIAPIPTINAFKSLTQLNLHSNKITSVEAFLFFDVESLEQLDLSNNFIASILIMKKLRMNSIKVVNVISMLSKMRNNCIGDVNPIIQFCKDSSFKSFEISFNQFSIFSGHIIKWLTSWIDNNLSKRQAYPKSIKHYPFSKKIKTPQILFDSINIIQNSIKPLKEALFDKMNIEEWESLIDHEEESYC